MYALRQIPSSPLTDARGLTLTEAFQRIMGLTGRAYRFTRTGRVMHLLMTDPPEADFLSHATNDVVARQEIMGLVCRHGLGEFEFMTDAQYERIVAGDGLVA